MDGLADEREHLPLTKQMEIEGYISDNKCTSEGCIQYLIT
jgi:hypothetical protein